MARDNERLADGLRRWLPRGNRITGVRTLSAGHSNETYFVEGLNEILRLPPSEEGLLPPYDMARQHAVMSAVATHAPGIPMPPMLELCTDPDVLGDEFYLMGALPGEAFEYSIPPRAPITRRQSGCVSEIVPFPGVVVATGIWSSSASS